MGGDRRGRPGMKPSKGSFHAAGKNLTSIDEMQPVATGAIAPRASMPPRTTRVRNRFPAERGPETGSNNQLAEHVDGLDRRTICENILVEGNVQTFVDFFYLTHRPGLTEDTMGPNPAPTGGIFVHPREMVFIKYNLVKAEEARRVGDTTAVYDAYNSLAEHFQEINDPKTGVYFYEKCLEISRLTSDRHGEMNANHHLGLVHDKMGDVVMAASFHERHEQLALVVDVTDERKVASAELIKVYRKFAEDREANGDFVSAIEHWSKSLEAAKGAQDRKAEGQANYRLGKAYTELGEPLRAVNFLEEFESISTDLDDLEGQGRAFEALAAACQSLDNDDKALSFLQRYLDVATKTQNLKAQEEACSNLAVLYSRRRQFSKAKVMFERNFTITRTMVNSGQEGASTALVDMSRAFLGMAAGKEMVEDYFHAIKSDMGALLDWNSNRVRPRPKT